MRPRIAEELQLLSGVYRDVSHAELSGDEWFLIPHYLFPEGWAIGEAALSDAPVAFRATVAYPTSEPYGFLIPAGARFCGAAPGSSGPPPLAVPFPGEWLHLSWAPDGSWSPTHAAAGGSNLLIWARSFGNRLREGA